MDPFDQRPTPPGTPSGPSSGRDAAPTAGPASTQPPARPDSARDPARDSAPHPAPDPARDSAPHPAPDAAQDAAPDAAQDAAQDATQDSAQDSAQPSAQPSAWEAAWDGPQASSPATDWSVALPVAARDVEDFLAATGWDQPPQLFALVPTARLLEAEPGLAERLPSVEGLTPVAQEPLPTDDLAETLAEICWPEGVAGCALAQEIVVLPPEAQAELDEAVAGADAAGESRVELDRVAVRVAQRHPDRREARLVVAVLRAGEHCCLMRLRGVDEAPDELVEHPDLAPNMVSALLHTLDTD